MNGTKLLALSYPLPPLAEQERIVAEVEYRLSSADEMEAAISSGLKQAERLRQAILRDAFTGKLVAQDPTDEPAVVLLERIRTARAVGDAAKKAGKGGGRKAKEPAAVIGGTVEKKTPAVSVAAASGAATGKRRGRPPKNPGGGTAQGRLGL